MPKDVDGEHDGGGAPPRGSQKGKVKDKDAVGSERPRGKRGPSRKACAECRRSVVTV